MKYGGKAAKGVGTVTTAAGKALGKGFAIDKADDIIFNVGRILDLPEVLRYYARAHKTEK